MTSMETAEVVARMTGCNRLWFEEELGKRQPLSRVEELRLAQHILAWQDMPSDRAPGPTGWMRRFDARPIRATTGAGRISGGRADPGPQSPTRAASGFTTQKGARDG